MTVGSVGIAGAQSASGWFSGVDNYGGVVDRTGINEVNVDVGVDANGGGYGFGPAAIRIDPGTTVVWTWTGAGNAHNVVETDGRFESRLTDEADATFEHSFDTTGVYRYVCEPHRGVGMKGAVVVGDADPAFASAGSEPTPEATDGGQNATAGGGGWNEGSGLLVTGVSLGLTAATVAGVYLFSWRDRPDPTFTPTQADDERVPTHPNGPMLESNVASRETESVDHDAFDPVGTGTLLAIYFTIITLAWLFMYFVEFLGNGPTVVG